MCMEKCGVMHMSKKGVKRTKDLWQSLEVFGWKELDVEALSELTVREVKLALKAIARRKVR